MLAFKIDTLGEGMVAFGPSATVGNIDLIVEVGVADGQLVGVYSNNRSCGSAVNHARQKKTFLRGSLP